MAFSLVSVAALGGLMGLRVSGCSPLPKGVVECGSFIQDPDRLCYKTWTGCAGATYYSYDGRNGTIKAVDFCIEQGYNGADPELFGASWGKLCRDPFSKTKGFANKVGGPITNLAGEVTWKCTGVQRQQSCAPSRAPSPAPSALIAPTSAPTSTMAPTLLPTMLPTSLPTVTPTLVPSYLPTGVPTTLRPSYMPTDTPTSHAPTSSVPDMTTRSGVETFCLGMSTVSDDCEFCNLFGQSSWSCSTLGCVHAKKRSGSKACRAPGKKIKCKKITFPLICASVGCGWNDKKSKCSGTVRF